MKTTHDLLLPLAAPFLLSALASAQALNFTLPAYAFPTPAAVSFGAAVAILDAVDGGRRDLVVSDPGTNNIGTVVHAGQIHFISADGPVAPTVSTALTAIPLLPSAFFNPFSLNLTSSSFNFGHAVLNVGNVDGQPGDEFAFSVPDAAFNRGTVAICSLVPFGSAFQVVLRRWFDGPNGFGRSLAMVDTPFNGRLLAIGSPNGGTNISGEVLLFNPSTGISPVTTPVLTLGTVSPTVFPLARIGDSVAGGVGGFVAAGAPGWVQGGTQIGFVAVYNLNTPGTVFTPQSFMLDTTLRNAGSAVVSLGRRGALLPDFATIARNPTLGGNSTVVAFRALASGSTTGWARDTMPGSTSVPDGSMAPAGDVDGDGLADFAACVGNQLRVYLGAASGGALVPLTFGTSTWIGAATRCGLTGGPDLNNQHFNPTLGTVTDPAIVEVVAGPAFSGSSLARTLSIAAVHRLTWDPLVFGTGVVQLASSGRPVMGTSFNLTSSTSLGTGLFTALWGDVAPVWQSPFADGVIFLGPTAVSLVSNLTPMVVPVNVPVNPSLLYVVQVFQSFVLDTASNIRLSNGIVIKIGN